MVVFTGFTISLVITLLDLASKIDRNTANWRQTDNLPNWHNVNIAQCFEPAHYFQQSKIKPISMPTMTSG
jgi:hypothetical protein